MKRVLLAATSLAAIGVSVLAAQEPETDEAAQEDFERGRYLVTIGGCNDCHTPGYLAQGGNVPEDRWLVGDSVGFSGPWGTTYPANLRSLLADMSEDEWIAYARKLESRPPMPWFNLRAFTEDDLRAMYRYVRSLPEDSSPVPDFVPPGEQPTTPHIVMVPQAPQQ
ncbi:cytochrome c [Chelativorans sp. SCAU2101]|uniref:Cytochrome c n=1 Tax=Chelativorans petroleitrophicus TaxID=2975484 RepID=A0A9X2XB97_9HYPH|nr:cytochrome c [Chelativorans petroleitrophicus]MCT8991576.1 cytochrome c [Chelativorans petroleitrophicus]